MSGRFSCRPYTSGRSAASLPIAWRPVKKAGGTPVPWAPRDLARPGCSGRAGPAWKGRRQAVSSSLLCGVWGRGWELRGSPTATQGHTGVSP